MGRIFARAGVRLEYPSGWRLDSEDTLDGWTVTLQSPGTAFMVLSLREEIDDPTHVAQETLRAMKSEYDDLEVEQAVDSLAGRPALGYNLRFFALDFSTICRLRAVACGVGVLLVLSQTSDLDGAMLEPVLRQISASLTIAEEEEAF